MPPFYRRRRAAARPSAEAASPSDAPVSGPAGGVRGAVGERIGAVRSRRATKRDARRVAEEARRRAHQRARQQRRRRFWLTWVVLPLAILVAIIGGLVYASEHQYDIDYSAEVGNYCRVEDEGERVTDGSGPDLGCYCTLRPGYCKWRTLRDIQQFKRRDREFEQQQQQNKREVDEALRRLTTAPTTLPLAGLPQFSQR